MRCSKCGAENPAGQRFCGNCAAALANPCPKCHADNPAGQRFCGQCGTALAATEVSLRSSSPPQTTAEVRVSTAGNDACGLTDGERRHLTVLFCDLVGSTEIAARLDPEEWRDIAAQYQRSAAEAVARLGGHVAEYLGTGWWSVSAGRRRMKTASNARGLAVVDAIALLNTRLTPEQRVKLSVRAGIDTGSVVVGRGGSNETRIFGQTPKYRRACAGP